MLAAVIQARMGSSRLPGKVVRRLGDRTVLEWVIRAAVESGAADTVVVATTEEPADDELVDIAEGAGAVATRGPVDDVLTRFVHAVDLVGADTLFRLTSDCPLLDPSVLAAVAGAFSSGQFDYLSTITPRSLPRGLDVEILSADALAVADRHAVDHHRAHVTSWLYSEGGDRIRRGGLVFAPAADDLRVTIDTAEDAALVEALVALLGDRAPSWRDIVELLRQRPDLRAINAEVAQKALHEG